MSSSTVALVDELRTIGEVAEATGLSARMLGHYDQIGLVCPSGRSPAGYRLYADSDVTRLSQVVVWRRLGLSLEEVATVLDGGNRLQTLRDQRVAIETRRAELADLATALDRAIEREETGMALTEQEQRELFGEDFSEEYAAEAQERWGDTEAWRASRRRTSAYSKGDWETIAAEDNGIREEFARMLAAGEPASGVAAMDQAEAHRQHINRWFYDCSPSFHRNLGEMYVSDPRFAASYERVAPGLAAYVRDAVVANADRLL